MLPAIRHRRRTPAAANSPGTAPALLCAAYAPGDALPGPCPGRCGILPCIFHIWASTAATALYSSSGMGCPTYTSL